MTFHLGSCKGKNGSVRNMVNDTAYSLSIDGEWASARVDMFDWGMMDPPLCTAVFTQIGFLPMKKSPISPSNI